MAFPPSYQFPQCTINATPFDRIALKALQRLRIQPTSTLCNARLTTYSLTRNLTFPIKLLTANFPIFFISTTFAPTPTLSPLRPLTAVQASPPLQNGFRPGTLFNQPRLVAQTVTQNPVTRHVTTTLRVHTNQPPHIVIYVVYTKSKFHTQLDKLRLNCDKFEQNLHLSR